jgi:hypothetical protein
MKKLSVLIISLLITALFLLAGCAGMKPAQYEKEATIVPAACQEECFELAPGQVLEYRFKASAPVDFNIHCHDGSYIDYVVKADNKASGQGTFRPERKQFYCLMWTNHSTVQPITLQYSAQPGMGEE